MVPGTKPDLAKHHLIKPAKSDDSLVSLPHHQRVQIAVKGDLVNPFCKHAGHAVLEHMTVDLPGVFHQRELVSALHCPDRGDFFIHGSHIGEREVLLHPPELGEGDKVIFEVHSRWEKTHTRRNIPVTPHFPDIWKERLTSCPLVTLPHPEDRITILRDEEEAVLHGSREVVEGNLADNGCKLQPGCTRSIRARKRFRRLVSSVSGTFMRV